MAALDLTGKAPAPAQPQKPLGLSGLIKAKVSNMMTGRKADEFVTSVISLVNGNPALAQCDQTSLVVSCLQAQSLNLSFHPGMGQCWVIPYNDRKAGKTVATFQMGYKGYIQLAIRSGQYRRLNVLAIKEGELKAWNPLLEEISLELIEDDEEREKAPTIGYYASFEYINGFTKALYWTRKRMEAHALRYSMMYRSDQQYGKKNSFWSKDFDAMGLKTMLRQLISKWGVMSVEMQTALVSDGRMDSGEYTECQVFDASDIVAPKEPAAIETETAGDQK